MFYKLTIVVTDDPQLEVLNVKLSIDDKNKALELLSLFAEQGYKVLFEETDED
ncbi:hypothetical protein GRF59_14890 [Paenibacillus sp. HJL G12]|uniref:Uncharacterized protein n=1 Tax=Paenibacillus dendrobii TaxID=2691084 RepID=A0A7X3IK44_9BACL|nr:hypothetical protein [Paenibacillus dendrobii]MWV44906.1 hypothetical protein [Paenibacillus dendrobii]